MKAKERQVLCRHRPVVNVSTSPLSFTKFVSRMTKNSKLL